MPSSTRRAVGVIVLATVVAGINGWASPAPIATSRARQGTALDTNAITPEMIAAGRRIFHGKGGCSACHGMNLEGDPVAPTLKQHSWKDAKDGDLGAIFYVDTHGVTGTVMVAHPGGISDAEATNVAAYIWSVSHRGTKP